MVSSSKLSSNGLIFHDNHLQPDTREWNSLAETIRHQQDAVAEVAQGRVPDGSDNDGGGDDEDEDNTDDNAVDDYDDFKDLWDPPPLQEFMFVVVVVVVFVSDGDDDLGLGEMTSG